MLTGLLLTLIHFYQESKADLTLCLAHDLFLFVRRRVYYLFHVLEFIKCLNKHNYISPFVNRKDYDFRRTMANNGGCRSRQNLFGKI